MEKPRYARLVSRLFAAPRSQSWTKTRHITSDAILEVQWLSQLSKHIYSHGKDLFIHPIPIWPTTLGRDWARSWSRSYWGNILESKLRWFDLSCENIVFIYTILRYIYILSACLQAVMFLNVTNRVLPRQQGKSVVFLLSKPAFTKKAVDSRHSPRRWKKIQDFLKREDKLPLGVSLTSHYFLDLTSRCLLRMSSKLRPLPAKGYMSRELSSR